MDITDRDRFFYSNAVEQLTERFEIAREFVRNNGLPSLPMEELTSLMITGIKDWVSGDDGEQWLSTLGYVRAEAAAVTLSGIHISLSGAMCPVCSGLFIETHGRRCEKCGQHTCSPCVSVVDPIYQVGWCSDCISEEPLTNLLVYNE